LRRQPFAIDIVFKYFRHNYSPRLGFSGFIYQGVATADNSKPILEPAQREHNVSDPARLAKVV
jgi:hypothetical protein